MSAVSDERLRWWYDEPASRFSEGAPIATGRFAGMVYGRVDEETITFDDETLWTGQPYDPHSPQAARALPRVRDLVKRGEYAAADRYARKLFAPVRDVQAYQPMGRVELSFDHDPGAVSGYERGLDMADAVADVSYVHDGVRYDREVFASHPDEVIVVRLTASEPGALSCTARLDSLQPSAESAPAEDGGEGDDAELRMRGSVGKEYASFVEKHLLQNRLEWASRLRVRAEGGTATTVGGEGPTDARVRIEDADAATLVLAGRTNYESWDWIDASDAYRRDCAADVEAATERGYDALRERHLRDWRPRFGACRLSLGGEERADEETRSRMGALDRAATTEADPHFVAQYFQYGRYLLLCASRPGTLPFNNHNVWLDRDLDGLEPRWDGRWTLNVNLQMCYWPAESTALSEAVEPLLAFVEGLAEAGERTARRVFDRPGWVSGLGADVWLNTAPHHWDESTIKGVAWGLFPTSGAWLCNRLWEHYRFDPTDEAFLERLYPLMKGSAEFFLSLLEEDPGTGWLVTYCSTSPENTYYTPDGEEAALDAMSAIDSQVLRDLFSHCIRASADLGVDAAFREELERARERLPPHQVGEHGLQEWHADREEVDPGHRHLSHLYAFHPSAQITPRDDPELAEAVREALERRVDAGGEKLGWSGAWRLNLWARFGDAERAERALKRTLTGASLHVAEGMSERVPSIDGNQGIQGLTAGIAQMLLQSHAGELDLLPALPEAWPEGSVEGLRARGGYAVDVAWADGRLTDAEIHATREGTCRVRTRTPVTVTRDGSPVETHTEEAGADEHVVEFRVAADETYALSPR